MKATRRPRRAPRDDAPRAASPRPRDEPAASTLDPSHLDALEADASASTLDLDLLELGRGAGGRVLRGPDRHLPRLVAWKIARGAHARARLQHEARALAALEHPAIVPIHDLVDGADGSLRIALRMVRGETLHVVARQATTREARLSLLRSFLQAVEAVAWAHRLGWIHRDLKPANIMVGELGETQVIDWGLAVCMDDGPIEPPGTIVGTAMTMSPEQARGEVLDARADVWGLGATLYEVLVGTTLFDGSDPHAVVAELAALATPLIHPSAPSLAGLPPELVAILARAPHPSLDQRYPDAGALAKDLIAFLDGRIVSAHTYRPVDHLRRFVRAYRLPIGIALAVLVTGTLAAVFAVVEIDRERDEAIAARQRADLAREEAVHALSARDREVARRGVTEARRELADLQRPEAELAAARTLALEESAEARGIIAAFAHAPRPQRTATLAAPPDCIDADLSPDGEAFLCGNRQSLTMRRGDRSWRLDRPYRQAILADGGARVLVSFRERALLAYDATDGHLVASYPQSRCLGTLRADPSGRRVMNRGQACAELITGPTLVDLDPCDGQHVEVAAIDAAGVFAALCIGGDLTVVQPDGTRRRLRTDIGNDADTLLAATLVGLGPGDGEALLVGSSAGELAAIDLAAGHIVTRRTLTPSS
ncbi:MAG: serine/threonine protein kinase, partial [Deltaproteobacteria bacterium]|nr:serine/threonine protein kinase [Deltaproteobacteria bacterium]